MNSVSQLGGPVGCDKTPAVFGALQTGSLGCAAGQAVQQTPVDQAMDELAMAVQVCHREINDLTLRLVPVLRQQASSTVKGDPERPTNCPHESRIRDLHRDVFALANSIRTARELLCL